MPQIMPQDQDPFSSPAETFPWGAMVIIAFALFVVGWVVMTAGAVNASVSAREISPVPAHADIAN